VASATSPTFTRALDFTILKGMENIVPLLLDPPSGLHLRQLVCSWFKNKGPRWIMEIVSKYSDTLECHTPARHVHFSLCRRRAIFRRTKKLHYRSPGPPNPTNSSVSRKTATLSSASSFSQLDYTHSLVNEEMPTSTAEITRRANPAPGTPSRIKSHSSFTEALPPRV
jgi:hypothetical protein